MASAGKPLIVRSLLLDFATSLSSAIALSNLFFVLAMRVTFAPLLTNCCARAKPMPVDPPVITACAPRNDLLLPHHISYGVLCA